METKEDKRAREQNQNKNRAPKAQVARNEDTNVEILGFGARPQRKEREEEPRENRDNKGKKDNRKGPRAQNKVTINQDDFPSL